jgi:DNA polymerase-1
MDHAKLPMPKTPAKKTPAPKKVSSTKAAVKKVPNVKKKRIVLLDAHAIIHRAYHALPDFTTPTGEPSGALYGLSSMLLRIIADLKPDYIASCYDLPKPTMRHEAYAEYKSTRAKIDPALVTQLTTSRRVFEAFCIPIYEREGFEADDILGTIVEMMKGNDEVNVVIASGDMDTMQLIDHTQVQVYTLRKGLTDTIMYDEKAVVERYGFMPEFIADYKGLRGDPSDNIIGIPGIGEKTATELIQNFGTIENIYTLLKKDEKVFLEKGIKPRIVGLLKEHEEDAIFSKMLATIRTDAPIDFELEKTICTHEEILPKVLALFDELGFRSIRSRARAVLGGGEVGASQGRGDTADTTDFANTDSSSSESFSLDGDAQENEEDLPVEDLADAKVLLWLLASEFTNPSLDDIYAHTHKKTFAEAYELLKEQVRETGRLQEVYSEIEKPLMPILKEMQRCGVMVDRKALEQLQKRYREELKGFETKIYELAGKEFLISSPRQLGDVLFDDLGLKAKGQKKTAGGQRSTRESELEKIRELHPIVDAILEYRQLQKLLSTYIEALPPLLDEGDRLHAEFLQAGTTTGRMASQNPNLQNIPIRSDRGRAIRDAFIARPGFTLLGFDYSQIELRLAAMLSGDELMCDIFRNGRDVHQEVAAQVFGVESDKVDREMRRRAKIINFGVLYGMGVNALRAQLGTTTAEAHEFHDDYFNTFTRLAAYLEEVRGFARKHGYTETVFGRRRDFSGIRSPLPFVRASAERMAINAPIQGTGADIIKLAMVRIEAMLKTERETGVNEDIHLLLQVHDELVFEVRDSRVTEYAHKIREIMESVMEGKETHGVPIIAEPKKGPHWGEMTPL